MAYCKYSEGDSRLFEVKEYKATNNSHSGTQTLITPRGRESQQTSHSKTTGLGYIKKNKGWYSFNLYHPFLLESNLLHINMGGFAAHRIYINGVVLGGISIDFELIHTQVIE